LDAGSHSPEGGGGGAHTWLPCGAPPHGADNSSFMPTPHLDPRLSFPFLDLNQVPAQKQEASLQASHAGEASGAEGVNQAFWNTFGLMMPYNTNLIMSLLGTIQQSQPLL